MDQEKIINEDILKKENQPFYSKYYIENFEEKLKKSKLIFLIPEEFDENNLYMELVEEE